MDSFVIGIHFIFLFPITKHSLFRNTNTFLFLINFPVIFGDNFYFKNKVIL